MWGVYHLATICEKQLMTFSHHLKSLPLPRFEAQLGGFDLHAESKPPFRLGSSNEGETLDKGWRGMLPCCYDNHRNVQAGSWWFLYGVGEKNKSPLCKEGKKKT